MLNRTPRRQFQPGFQARPVQHDPQEVSSFGTPQSSAETEKSTSVFSARPHPLLPLYDPIAPYEFIPPAAGRQFPAPTFLSARSRLRYPSDRLWYSRALAAFIVVGSLLLLVLGSLWLNSRANADVTLYQVQSQHTVQVVGGGGMLYPHQQLNITYPVAERVQMVLVQAGDQVAPNQPLLRLDTTQLNAQLNQAADNVAASQSYLSTVSVNGNAVTVARAQQQLTLAKNKYTALLAQSSYPLMHAGNLVSSLRGVVTAVNINAGEIFSPNAILLVIMDESALIAHMQVPLANVGQVRPGEQAQLTPPTLATHVFSGTVNAVIPQADPQNDTFEAWVSVNDPQHLLLPGMNVFVRILIPTTAFVVPRLSVLSIQQLTTVFVVYSQHAYLRSVRVLGRYEDHLLISSGLQSAEYIVLLGLYQLHDGQMVHVRSIEHPGGTL